MALVHDAEPAPRFVDDCCANCLLPLPDDLDGLFCTEDCQQAASTIRYYRRVASDGRLAREGARLALRRRFWFALNGGYSARARRISPAVRAQVSERGGGRCRACGGVGEQVDHIHGDSPALDNLQLLCRTCHDTKTDAALFGAVATVLDGDDPTKSAEDVNVDLDPRAVALLNRAFAPVPMLLCDDEVAWEGAWRSLKDARWERLLDEAEREGVDMTARRTARRAEVVIAVADARADVEPAWRVEDDDSGYGPDSYFARAMSKDD